MTFVLDFSNNVVWGIVIISIAFVWAAHERGRK